MKIVDLDEVKLKPMNGYGSRAAEVAHLISPESNWSLVHVQLGLRRVEIVAALGNKASRRVAEKTGAHFEGILRKRIKIGEKMHRTIGALCGEGEVYADGPSRYGFGGRHR